MRALQRTLHAAAAFAALAFIASFWLATAVAELWLSPSAVAATKQAIAYALWAFVPTMAALGGTGFALGAKGQHRLLVAKRRRMPFIALNGLLVLVPAALYLNAKAQAGAFDGWFYAVQGAELVAGAVNLVLIGFNVRDGLALGRARK